jgi:hypothetical protein
VKGTGLHFRCLAGLLVACLLVATPLAAEETGIAAPAQPETKDKPVKAVPVYRPPPRGSPAVRVGGATRGAGDPLPALHVLAPDHIAMTVQPQPVFQWYLSKPAQVRFEFALVSENSIDPLLERDFGTVHSRGIQQFNLADTDIVLQPGIPYQWSVALIPDEEARSGDVVASGMIERIALSEELAARLAGNTSDYAQAIAYAEAGIWYDALAILSKLIRENPADATLRTQRAALLEQVGLPAVGLPDVSTE